MSESELLAAAAHLHVVLRRKTGRIIDTEWIAANEEYARAMVEFAREKARTEGHTELIPLADRLDRLMDQRRPRPPVTTSPVSIGSSSDKGHEEVAKVAIEQARDALNTRYIGRLRG